MPWTSAHARTVAALMTALAVGCGGPAAELPSGPVPASPSVAETTPGPEPATAPSPAPPATPALPSTPIPELVPIAYRVEVRTSDAATAGFAEDLREILTDPRGWVRAGFAFVEDPSASYRIVLAEGPEVDALCLPLETRTTYSCQNGPVVALNADRWRAATPQWTGDLAAYRTMLVNHEVGHLLHLHHPTVHCPAAGLPAPVMAQQSTELGACLPNPWPLQWEVDLAAERREPLAPPADHDPSDHRPVPPAVDH